MTTDEFQQLLRDKLPPLTEKIEKENQELNSKTVPKEEEKTENKP